MECGRCLLYTSSRHFNGAGSRNVSHELFYALPAVGRLPGPVLLGDLSAHSGQHIGETPGRQLTGFYRNCYGTPVNIFFYQLCRLLSHLGTICPEVVLRCV